MQWKKIRYRLEWAGVKALMFVIPRLSRRFCARLARAVGALVFEIDNNLIENAIRPTAVGKKNWLFIGEAAAGERSAILYTVIENCRRRGIDPFSYLKEVFTRLPSMTNWQVKDITPKAWAKQQSRTVLATAA